jgi:hypothetical protein
VGPLSLSSSRKSKLPKAVYLGSFSRFYSVPIRDEDSELASWYRDDRTQKVDEWKYVDVPNDNFLWPCVNQKVSLGYSQFPPFHLKLFLKSNYLTCFLPPQLDTLTVTQVVLIIYTYSSNREMKIQWKRVYRDNGIKYGNIGPARKVRALRVL